jgi:hypothetical protein
MSRQRLRARLAPLERIAPALTAKRDRDPFRVDPKLAKAIHAYHTRMDELLGIPLDARSVEAERAIAMLRERITALARSIALPTGYGALEARDDTAPLTWTKLQDESFDEAQARARLAAYALTPEARDRERIFDLIMKGQIGSGRCTTAEEAELEQLRQRYPEVPIHPDDPLRAAIEAWGAAAREAKQFSRRR